MRLIVTQEGVGHVRGDEVDLLDLPYPDIGGLLRGGGLDEAATAGVRATIALSALTPLAPVFRPGKVLVAGLNYAGHAAEANLPPPDEPICCVIPGSAINGPGQPIRLPERAPRRVDYEGEVAVVIGTRASNVTAAKAWDHVAGLTICNDVSARDVAVMSTKRFAFDMALSKAFDTFKPIGPFFVTADEFEADFDLSIKTWVNGELRQDSRTSDMIFCVPTLIEHMSSFMTLEPGDVIATGTPEGVGMATKRWLASGDTVRIDVEGIGSLVNTVA